MFFCSLPSLSLSLPLVLFAYLWFGRETKCDTQTVVRHFICVFYFCRSCQAFVAFVVSIIRAIGRGSESSFVLHSNRHKMNVVNLGDDTTDERWRGRLAGLTSDKRKSLFEYHTHTHSLLCRRFDLRHHFPFTHFTIHAFTSQFLSKYYLVGFSLCQLWFSSFIWMLNVDGKWRAKIFI